MYLDHFGEIPTLMKSFAEGAAFLRGKDGF